MWQIDRPAKNNAGEEEDGKAGLEPNSAQRPGIDREAPASSAGQATPPPSPASRLAAQIVADDLATYRDPAKHRQRLKAEALKHEALKQEAAAASEPEPPPSFAARIVAAYLNLGFKPLAYNPLKHWRRWLADTIITAGGKYAGTNSESPKSLMEDAAGLRLEPLHELRVILDAGREGRRRSCDLLARPRAGARRHGTLFTFRGTAGQDWRAVSGVLTQRRAVPDRGDQFRAAGDDARAERGGLQPLRAERRDLERQFRGTAQELCRSFRPAPPAPTRGKAKDKGTQKGGRRKGTSGRAGPRLRRPPPRYKPRPQRHKPLGRSRRT
jgi:hypothetical protein